jgi:indolepyruvate ferredoxin oxidoreductase beta subunit
MSAREHAAADAMTSRPRAITIAILAMGGEGGGVLSDWIVDLAEHAGYRAQTTSVPGVAQRTGSTIYYVEIFPEEPVRTAGKPPVFALMPVPGEVDIVLASELMEAGRAIQRGLVTPDRTTLIASTHRVYSMTEKTAIGDGKVDSGQLIEACRTAAKTLVQADFEQMAAAHRSVISAVLFGALAGTAALPFDRDAFEEAIRRGEVGVDSSLAAFAAGFRSATLPVEPEKQQAGPRPRKSGHRLHALAERIQSSFPPQSHDILLSGVERLADYQDERYAADYLDRLDTLTTLEAAHGDGQFRLLRETGRHLALWMSYEDAIRVADLKTRRTRFERVQRESRAADAQLVNIREFLHPGVEEIADILPARLGRWLANSGWVTRRIAQVTNRGMIVETTSLRGFLQLYVLASLRPWRRASLRFQDEHRRIGEWLAVFPTLAREDYALARELAELPRVVKGYGDTHHRGRRSFDEIMRVLPTLRQTRGAAAIVRTLRDAALADDTGQQFAAALKEVGA